MKSIQPVAMFRNIDNPSEYVIVEKFETIDGPRERVSRRFVNLTPEKAMREFEKAKNRRLPLSSGILAIATKASIVVLPHFSQGLCDRVELLGIKSGSAEQAEESRKEIEDLWLGKKPEDCRL